MWCTRTIRNDDHRREQRKDSCFLVRLCCILAVGTEDPRREQSKNSSFLVLLYHIPMLRTLWNI